MNKTLTEQKVLRKLGIADFRHLSKEKVVNFVSMLPHMDPEVAKKALEQVPDFSRTALAVIEVYRASLERIVASNESSMQAFFDACKLTLESLQAELARDDLSSEERSRISGDMVQVVNWIAEKDSENKTFLTVLAGTLATACIFAIAALAAVLGASANGHWDDK